ncbi:MAG: ABC transporter permease [Acidimicrobiales bacterium]
MSLRRVAGRQLVKVIAVRVLTALPVLGYVAFISFLTTNAFAGDATGPVRLRSSRSIKPGILALSQPFFERFWQWIQPIIAHGYFGSSLLSGEPVGTVIASRIPVTAELLAFSLVISFACALPVAIAAARRPGGPADRVSRVISTAGLGIPALVLALVLLLVFGSGEVTHLRAFVPLSQGVTANLASLLLPAVAIAFGAFCVYSRLLRAEIIDQTLGHDYVVTARAKGAGSWRVLLSHILGNSMLGSMRLSGRNLAGVIGATVVVEQIFAIPGIGQGLLVALNDRDFPVVNGFVLTFAVAVVIAGLLSDVAHAVLDPRTRRADAIS